MIKCSDRSRPEISPKVSRYRASRSTSARYNSPNQSKPSASTTSPSKSFATSSPISAQSSKKKCKKRNLLSRLTFCKVEAHHAVPLLIFERFPERLYFLALPSIRIPREIADECHYEMRIRVKDELRAASHGAATVLKDS